jgi:hypothetical protein
MGLSYAKSWLEPTSVPGGSSGTALHENMEGLPVLSGSEGHTSDMVESSLVSSEGSVEQEPVRKRGLWSGLPCCVGCVSPSDTS